MPTVLIVSPRFPPINGADIHRVRISLPYFAQFGWRPVVLAVDPLYADGTIEPLLLETIPTNAHIHRVRALPVSWTRKIGLSDLGLRALPFLQTAGAELIKKHNIDLVYFSTTAFTTMTLGRIWKERFGVPYVIDMQDPWVNNYTPRGPNHVMPFKSSLARAMHRTLESWTMKSVDGVLAVSSEYIKSLHRRYPRLVAKPQKTLPFGASEVDFEIIQSKPQSNRFFRRGNGQIHGVYVGRGGKDMADALGIMFRALQIGLQKRPELFSPLQLHFIGTDYAPDAQARKTVEPIAVSLNLSDFIHEYPRRVPYFEALQLLLDADFLIVPGSADPRYTASKIYPYILARRPLLAVFNEHSSVCDVMLRTAAGSILPFSPEKSPYQYDQVFIKMWEMLLDRLPYVPEVNWSAFAPYTAREMTRQQCELFYGVYNKQTRC